LKSFFTCSESPTEGQDNGTGFILHSWARGAVGFVGVAYLSPYITTVSRFAAAKDEPYDSGIHSYAEPTSDISWFQQLG
jgi:hypothetical protein